MLQEISTSFTPIINAPGKLDFYLAKDTNNNVYVCSVNCGSGTGAGTSMPYDQAVAMNVVYGFSMRDKKLVIAEIPMPPKLMVWLMTKHVRDVVNYHLADSNK